MKKNAEIEGSRQEFTTPRRPVLRRLTLHVTDQEREELMRYARDEGLGESVREMLECFVADLTNSERRRLPLGRHGADYWRERHHECRQFECRNEKLAKEAC